VLKIVIHALFVNCLVGVLVSFIYPSLGFTGIDLHESGHGNWLIQTLFEYALSMKLSLDYQAGRICLSALHGSSGKS